MKRCLGCMGLYEDEFELCPHCGYIEGTEAEEAIHMEPGTILSDRYIIGKVLGYGGFGVTYIGWDGKLQQKVAVKEYLPSEFSTRMPGQSRVTVFNGDKSEQFYDGLKKFVDEAKRLAKFQNEPGIVKVFDSFIENDTAYIIMEYLDGETVSSRLKREGMIPEDEAVDMLLTVMESLQVVHAEGILHRDIAPDNIFITKNGETKLIDFGASRYATTSHSRSLTVIIKPGYSPEEQYRSSEDQGPHTDVYALGACLYKMITGKTPPDAMERRAKFESQNKDILVPPHKLNRNISLVRETAILNAMNVRIEDRTPDVLSLALELSSTVPIKRRNGRIKKLDIYGWPKWFKILAALLVISFITVGTLMATGVIRVDSLFSTTVDVPDGMVQVPLVEGIANAKATNKLEKQELNVYVAGAVTTEYVEAGKIVLQEPASGMLCDKNSIVSLYISRGNGEIIKPVDGKSTVPYLVGSTEEQARADMKVAGLGDPQVSYEYDDNFAEGSVMSQNKNFASTVNEGTSLKLVVSKGSKPFELPNVSGMKRSEADKILRELSLNVDIVTEETSEFFGGMVISQNISAGTEVRKFDTIELTVAEAVWSDWTTEKPDEVEGRTIETKLQYSYSDYETTTQNDNNTLNGWTLDSSKTKTFYADDFKPFSAWDVNPITATDIRAVETKTQYQFRDKEFVSSTSPSMSGYTLGEKVPNVGSWSGWSTTAVSPYENDTQKVEVETGSTETVLHQDYVYFCYYYYNTDAGAWYNTTDYGYASAHTNQEVQTIWNTTCSPMAAGGTSSAGTWYAYGQYHLYYFGRSDHKGTVTQYRTRTTTYSYTLWRWGNWTDFSDNYVNSSDSREVNTRLLYRYADKIPHTKYTFYRWTDYTDFSDEVAEESTVRKVNTRPLYRKLDIAE